MQSEWKKVRLEDITTKLGDGLHGTPKYDESGDYFFINGNNLGDGKIEINSNTKRVNYEEYLKHQKELTNRTVFVSINGTLGNVGLYNGEKVCLGKSACYFNVKDNVDKHYVKYIMTSKIFQHYIEVYATGTTIKNMGLKAMRNFAFNLPPLPTQKKIAHILSSLDDKIELNRKMNQTLEEMAQALFKSWFVDFEPVHAKADAKSDAELDAVAAELGIAKEVLELFPSELVESEMGMIPLGWEIKTLGNISDVIDCLHSKKPKQLDYPSGNILLQLNNIQDNGLLDTNMKYFISDDDYAKWISRIEIRKNDFVITNVGRVGAVSKVPSNFNAAIGRNITAIRAKKDFEYIGYLQTLLTSKYMKSEINKKTDIGTILNALNVKNIPLLRFISAKEEIMSCFESIVSSMQNRRELNQREIQVLQHTRDTLLPKLLSGELDVSELEVS